MLIAYAEQFPVFIARPETKLDVGCEAVGLEAEGVLDVALFGKCGGDSRRQASRARPARVALTARLREAANTRPVLPAPCQTLRLCANFLCLRAACLTAPRQSRVGQIIHLVFKNQLWKICTTYILLCAEIHRQCHHQTSYLHAMGARTGFGPTFILVQY